MINREAFRGSWLVDRGSRDRPGFEIMLDEVMNFLFVF